MRGPRRAHPSPAYAASPAQIPETAVNPARRGLTRRTPAFPPSWLPRPPRVSLLPTTSLPGSLGRFGRMSPPARRSCVRFPLGSQESRHGKPVLGSNPSHLTFAIRFVEPPRHSKIDKITSTPPTDPSPVRRNAGRNLSVPQRPRAYDGREAAVRSTLRPSQGNSFAFQEPFLRASAVSPAPASVAALDASAGYRGPTRSRTAQSPTSNLHMITGGGVCS